MRTAKEQELLDLAKKYDTEDVHLARACEMTGKSKDEITPEERKRAKDLNYRALYSK